LDATTALYLSQISDSIEQVVVATKVRMARVGGGALEPSSWWPDFVENEQPSKAYQCKLLRLTLLSDPGSAMAMKSIFMLCCTHLRFAAEEGERCGGGSCQEKRLDPSACGNGSETTRDHAFPPHSCSVAHTSLRKSKIVKDRDG
jgi:hypothetical protein